MLLVTARGVARTVATGVVLAFLARDVLGHGCMRTHESVVALAAACLQCALTGAGSGTGGDGSGSGDSGDGGDDGVSNSGDESITLPASASRAPRALGASFAAALGLTWGAVMDALHFIGCALVAQLPDHACDAALPVSARGSIRVGSCRFG